MVWHCHVAAKRNATIHHTEIDVAIKFAGFEVGGLQHLGYLSREGPPFADAWCEGVERTPAEGVEAAFLSSSWQRLHNGVVIWAHVFLWMVDILGINFEFMIFLVCYICFIDNSFHKFHRYKHVDKVLILREMCNFCVWDFYTVTNACVGGYSYAKYFCIPLRSCARKITKIRLHL